MKLILGYLTIVLLFQHSKQLRNLLNTDFHECVKCVCHATTGCYQRTNCANYSISYEYWQKAGYPTLSGSDPNNHSSYNKCIRDENCILNTIRGYSDNYSYADCDCDGNYDCIDIFKLHLLGENCGVPLQDYQVSRYNSCASRHRLNRMVSNTPCIINIR